MQKKDTNNPEDNQDEPTLDEISYARDFKALCTKLEGVRKKHDATELALDGFELALAEFGQKHCAAPARGANRLGDGTVSPDGRHTAKDDTLMQMAERGAVQIELLGQSDGSARVQVDWGYHFRLPPQLARLLTVITPPSAADRGPMEGWKSIETIARELGIEVFDTKVRHRIYQLVHRLRKELKEHGVNRLYVQSNTRYGVRFNLKDTAQAVIDDKVR